MAEKIECWICPKCFQHWQYEFQAIECEKNCSENKNKRKDGLTEREGIVMDSLVNAWNEYINLPKQHSSDLDDFCDGIHKCQHALMIRILRRDYPEGYHIKI